MVAYSFKQQFVAPILSGAKRQTIRVDRKRHARIGEPIQLYTGMRTRQCKAIGTALCENVCPITLDFSSHKIDLNGIVYISKLIANDFARSDGFSDWTEMKDFWRINHPDVPVFSGILIRWNAFKPAETTVRSVT